MSLLILGMGTALPEHFISQSDAATLASSFCSDGEDHARALTAIYRRTRVQTRHSVLLGDSTNGHPAAQSFYAPAISSVDRGPSTAMRMQSYEQHAAELAFAASERAIEESGLTGAAITHLVTVSCTGFSAPGFDMELAIRTALPAHVQRTHIGFMGCHGALNGLRVARAFAESDPHACVLLCAVELCSLHQQYGWDPDRIVSNALFADGAAAMVMRAGPNSEESVDRELRDWRVIGSRSTIIPDTSSLMGWQVRNHGFEMSLSPRVPQVILEHLRPWMDQWLSHHAMAVDDIRGWAIHPGGPRILQACQESLGLEDFRMTYSREVLAELGNMSSPTVLFIVDRLRRQHDSLPCVMLGFGPGLAIEAALVV